MRNQSLWVPGGVWSQGFKNIMNDDISIITQIDPLSSFKYDNEHHSNNCLVILLIQIAYNYYYRTL